MQLLKVLAHRRLAWIGLLAYTALLLKVVLFKYPGGLSLEVMSAQHLELRLQYANFTPLKTILYYLSGRVSSRIAVANLAGNLVLLGPLGFLVPHLFARWCGLWATAAICFGVSLLLEGVQLLTGLGSFDVDDLLLNLVGGILGWALYQGMNRLMGRMQPKS